MKDKFSWIIGLMISLCTLGVIMSPINPFALADKLEKVELRLDQKILNDNIDAWQRQIFDLESYYRLHPPMPKEVEKQILELKLQIDQARKDLNK